MDCLTGTSDDFCTSFITLCLVKLVAVKILPILYNIFINCIFTHAVHSECSFTLYGDINSHCRCSLHLVVFVGEEAENMNHLSDTQAVYTLYSYQDNNISTLSFGISTVLH